MDTTTISLVPEPQTAIPAAVDLLAEVPVTTPAAEVAVAQPVETAKKTRKRTVDCGTAFEKNGKVNAFLENSGRLTVADETGGEPTVYESYKDFLQMVGERAKGTPDGEGSVDLLKQLSKLLGTTRVIAGTDPDAKREEFVNQMKNVKSAKHGHKTTATKPPARKEAKSKAPAKVKEPVEMKPCGCGCGEQVKNNFKQGHDARFHGWLKRYQRGELKMGELNVTVQSYIRRNGIKQSVAK